VDPAVPAGQDTDWQARYQAEVQDRIKERERYKPFATSLSRLDDTNRAAILDLVDAAANGDDDAIAQWTEATYTNLRGASLAAQIAARQAGGTQPAPVAAPPPATAGGFGAPPPPEAPLTAERVAQIVEQQVQQRMHVQQMAQTIQSELSTAGFPAETAAGQTIIQYARQTGKPISEAVAWFEQDVQSAVLSRHAAAAQAAGQVPPPAPTGMPAGAGPTGATPREKAISRLTNARNQPGT
jgi:hypothetical protein